MTDAGGAMLARRGASLAGPAAQVGLLAALGATAGLSALGWIAGLVAVAAVAAMEARGLSRYAHVRGPADLVTLARAVVTCGVAALVADSFVRTPPVVAFVVLTVPALALDAVDGWVARRTRTASAFGGWFDGEVDAVLILVLSVGVARTAGAWVLVMGAARYAFGLAGLALPWLRRALPPRYWRKVVTATVGIALAASLVGILPGPAAVAALLVALALLAESFGRDVLWLWARRATGLAPAPVPPVRVGAEHGHAA